MSPAPVDSAGFGGLNELAGNANPLKSMPRGGIEPPTRGFSDLRPVWPSPRILYRKSVSGRGTVAQLSHRTADESLALLLPTSVRTTPRTRRPPCARQHGKD